MNKDNGMNKDQVKGRVKEAKGKVKTEVGKALDDKSLEGKGRIEKAAGKIQSGYGDLKHKVKQD